MDTEKGYHIEISSPYGEFWRYNVALMCGCFDARGERCGFASAESCVAEVGAALDAPPADYPARRRVRLDAPACDHLICYLYLIPHTLPAGRDTDAAPPFPIRLRIRRPDGEERQQTLHINQWSGASIELRLPEERHAAGEPSAPEAAGTAKTTL